MPADIVKAIDGGGADASQIAWATLLKTLSQVGTYESVVFDDALVHAVVDTMGGWMRLGELTDDDLKIMSHQFFKTYQGLRNKAGGITGAYPAVLIGIIEAYARGGGHKIAPPKLIGDATKALAVIANGNYAHTLQVTNAGQMAQVVLKNMTIGVKAA